MPQPSQGQIWMADLPAPLHRRPVLILTRSSAIAHLQNVTIATISSRVRGIDAEVELTPQSDQVAQQCAVSLDNLLTLPKHYLDRFVCDLSAERMNEVFAAIHIALALPF
jgi:mRNA interferase MazF